MAQARVLILRAPGTNCDQETAYAFQQAGARTEILHINRLLEKPELSDHELRKTGYVLIRRDDSLPDPQITSGGIEYEMADFITGMRITYYDGTRWEDNWDSKIRKGLPEKVKVELIPDEKTGLGRTNSIVISIPLEKRSDESSFESTLSNIMGS